MVRLMSEETIKNLLWTRRGTNVLLGRLSRQGMGKPQGPTNA